MIISASRRTDIPAFYAKWLRNRLHAGYCTVPNPFNTKQVTRISLRPEDVDAIVFWTRNPRPLFPYLDELNQIGYRYYFLFTLIGYPRALDPKSPPATAALDIFKKLSARLGPERVIWRYDPIVLTSLTSVDYHRANFQRLAEMLRGHTRRCIVSAFSPYRKTDRRMQTVPGVQIGTMENLGPLMSDLAAMAQTNAMDIASCASTIDWQPCDIRSGKCIDDALLAKIFGLTVPSQKDQGQRPACGCVVSRDIGMYDSCLFGCQYCYATRDFTHSRENYERHDPRSPSLLGWFEG